jgi:hypothetical protein
MSSVTQIYVGLRDEGVQVWRPVCAEYVREDIYRILDQPYDSSVESWQFGPGDEVHCKIVATPNGHLLAATRKVESSMRKQ